MLHIVKETLHYAKILDLVPDHLFKAYLREILKFLFEYNGES